MRLALLMSHASRSMRGGMRELVFCRALRDAGVDAHVWRIHSEAEMAEEEILGVPVTYCPTDDPTPIAHRQVSAVLRTELAAWKPDIVLYKGLGYRVCADMQAMLPGVRYGFIVGGGVTDSILPGADLVMGEYAEQLERHFPDHLRRGCAMVMPKHIDWALAGDGIPPEDPEFEIVNVGSFAEKRKNQIALMQFTSRRICFVGGGPYIVEAKQAARRARIYDNMHFAGQVAHEEVFGFLKRSKVLVHTSVGDGLPRAAIEAMACGLPVVAYRDTIPGGIPPEAGFLVSEAGLPHAARLLLDDDVLRQQMGRAARRHVERTHGDAAIAAAAGEVLERLGR